jgi:guanine deaminase
MDNDRSLLKRAIKLAGSGIREGGGPFGAVITKQGKVIAEATNKVVLLHDPTAHAEILAIRKASEVLRSHNLSECIIYASCEPCPMCLGAIYWAGIRKVVYASDRFDAEASGFNDSFIYNEIRLDPSARKIDFIHLPDSGGEEVFMQWEQFEDKIPY